MKELTSKERYLRMFEHRDADRIPMIDNPWDATLERWEHEGLPAGADFVDYFGLDRWGHIIIDTSPRYEKHILEETEEYVVYTSPWGVTERQWKHTASTPEFLDFTIVDPDSWRAAKARMTPDRDRINWEYLDQHYPAWRKEGNWIVAHGWFGFDITHSWAVGTERLLMALVEDPEWCIDMFNHQLDVNIALLEMVCDAGYTFDSVTWPDDMGYKQNQFFSVSTYRNILKPVHARMIDWAHSKGIKAHLHSCGDVNPMVPELIEIGLDALHPLEVKAGMDPLHLKKTYGDKLVLHGGIDALLCGNIESLEAEMHRIIPAMKEHGGYILSTDHSIPSSMSLQDFGRFVELGKELGSYQ